MSDGDVRDPNTGRYVKKPLTSEKAREMQKARYEKPVKETAASILAEAGYSDGNPAPASVKLMVDIAVSKRGNSVAAMREVLRMTGKIDKQGQPGTPAPGTVCPLCNELVMSDFRPDDSQLEAAMEAISDNGDKPNV